MYVFISGKILEKEKGILCIQPDGMGIGFQIFTTQGISNIHEKDEKVTLQLYTHRTESTQTLFGFHTLAEKNVFEELLKISGVGGKAALSILNLGLDHIAYACQEEDVSFLQQAQGVGKKTAQKILLELKEKVKDLIPLSSTTQNQNHASHGLTSFPSSGQKQKQEYNNIIHALTQMGYDKRASEQACLHIPDNTSSIEEKIVFCIQYLS